MEVALCFLSLCMVLLVQQGQSSSRYPDDDERHCDERILPGFQECFCDYHTINTGPEELTAHQLHRINCTNRHFANGARYMLGTLSQHLEEGGYTELNELVFTGNDINELPPNFVGRNSMVNLEVLDLSNNRIHIIHGKTFHSMPELIELYLDNNEWHVDPQSSRALSSIFNLEILSLNNAFTTVEEVSLHITALSVVFADSKLDYLRELYLENNRMLKVTSDVFQHLPSLEKLSLANNNINNLDNVWNSTCIASEYVDKYMALDHECQLRHLDLSFNSITTVPSPFIEQISRLKNLTVLNLTGNTFVCDCHLMDFFQLLSKDQKVGNIHLQKIIPNYDQLVCDNPPDLKGRTLVGLVAEELVCDKGQVFQESGGKHKNVGGIVFAVLFSMIAVLSLIGLYLNRDLVMKKAGKGWHTVKQNLPYNKGYTRFELNDDKVEPVGV